MALLSEKFLMNIAEKIGPPLMMRFAIQLGIKSYRIDQIKDNCHDSVAANFAILQDWNKKEKSDAIEEFKVALKTIPELKYVYDMIGTDELGPYEDAIEVIDLTTSNRRVTRSKSVTDIPPIVDLTNEDISSDLPDNGLKDATAKKNKLMKRKTTANTQRKGMQKAKIPRTKKAQYEVAIPDINEQLIAGFCIQAKLLEIDQEPHEMINKKGFTFLATFADKDQNYIDARYYGVKGVAMNHHQILSTDSDDSGRWFKIRNVDIEGEDKIKGRRVADHPCRIKIKTASRFELVEPPRNPLANIENKSDM